VRPLFCPNSQFALVGHKWLLALYPGGDCASTDGMVSMYLISVMLSKIVVKFDIIVKLARDGNFRKIASSNPVAFTGRMGQDRLHPTRHHHERFRYCAQNGTLPYEVRVRPASEHFCRVAEPTLLSVKIWSRFSSTRIMLM
jgi:hypothetical protein